MGSSGLQAHPNAKEIAPVTTPPEFYRLIPLTQGQFAKVDADRFEELSAFKWYAKRFHQRGSYYAARSDHSFNPPKTILMHRQIKAAGEGSAVKVDHADHNGLNNQDFNLRLCSNAENCRNKGAHSNNKLGVKGVDLCTFKSGRSKFRAAIMIDGRRISLGYFFSIEEARGAYDEAAKKHHGNFAQTNTPS
jgi:hypothetical protein